MDLYSDQLLELEDFLVKMYFLLEKTSCAERHQEFLACKNLCQQFVGQSTASKWEMVDKAPTRRK